LKTERHAGFLRHAKLAAAIIAPLFALGAAAALAQEKKSDAPAQEKKSEVRIGDGDLSLCGVSPRTKTDSEKSCLRERVRTVTTEARPARMQDGSMVEGVLHFVGRDTYDERGNRILIELSDSGNGPGPVGVVFRRGVQSFDEQGRMTDVKWYEPGSDEPHSAISYTYDERGNRIKIDSWRTKPDAHIIFKSSYDADGHEVETTFKRLTPEGWKTSKSKNVTTVEGRLTSVRTYSQDGALMGRTEFLRDERGNILSEELYGMDAQGEEQLQRKVTYRYDERGFLREVVYNKAEASLGARGVYEYDEHSNCTSLTRYNADGTFAIALQRKYEYDAAGNWVKCITFSQPWEHRAPEPFNVVRRQITYY